MNKNQYSKLRYIHRFFLYVVFVTIGLIMLVGAGVASELIELGSQNPFEKLQQYIAAILLAAGVPYLLIGAYIVLIGSPMAFYSLESLLPSQERLEAHFKVKLDERNYEEPLVLVDDPEMKIIIRRKAVMNCLRVFAIIHAPVLSASLEERIGKRITKHLQQSDGSSGNVFLTILLCADRDSNDFSSLVRNFGQNLSVYAVAVGFNFELESMSFMGKIDGLLADKRKGMLKAFLSMLPEAQRYLGLDLLDGEARKTRDQIVWPTNPNKIPRGIHFLWSISCFGLSMMGFLIGAILISNDGLVYAFFAVLVFVYAIFMIGVGFYQITKRPRHCPGR